MPTGASTLLARIGTTFGTGGTRWAQLSGRAPTTAEPYPTPPTIDDAQRARNLYDRLRRKRGRAASILSDNAPANVGTTMLMGAPPL